MRKFRVLLPGVTPFIIEAESANHVDEAILKKYGSRLYTKKRQRDKIVSEWFDSLTVADLKKILSEFPDNLVIFQGSSGGALKLATVRRLDSSLILESTKWPFGAIPS